MRKLRRNFPLLRHIVYLDNAAGMLKPLTVVRAMTDFYLRYPFNPHSADSRLGAFLEHEIAQVRQQCARLLWATEDEISFTSGTTDSLNRAARMIEPLLVKGDKILLSPYNHASNVVPFIELATRTGASVVYGRDLIAAMDKKVKVIALAQMNNTLNTNNDMDMIYTQANKRGIIVINDAAQAIAHETVTLRNADIVAFSGNKLYGPTGIGVLAVKKQLLNQLKPVVFGGGATATITKNDWQAKDGFWQFEVGTPNTAGIIGLGAALRFYEQIKFKAWVTEHEMASYAYKRLTTLPNVELISEHGDVIILFNIKNAAPQDVVSYLGHKRIILRAGEHCAKMMHATSTPHISVRLSLAPYNTKRDIDKLIKRLRKGGDFLDFI